MKHKILLLTIKYIPFLLALIYLLATVLSVFGINIILLSWLAYCSPLCLLTIYVASWILNFCIWHRLPIYYIMTSNIINYINWGFYISPESVLCLNVILIGILILFGGFLKNKLNEKSRTKK